MLSASLFGRLDERRVRWWLAAFFAALAVPAALLIAQAFDQLKWGALRSSQLLAEDFAARIDGNLRAAVAAEEGRAFGEYSFLVVEGDAAANFVQRSPLSAFPVPVSVPGALGYFQVDPAGTLSTPLLPQAGFDPEAYGIGRDELAERAALFKSISDVLAANSLVSRAARDAADAAASSTSAASSAMADSARGEIATRVAACARDPAEREAAAPAADFAAANAAAPVVAADAGASAQRDAGGVRSPSRERGLERPHPRPLAHQRPRSPRSPATASRAAANDLAERAAARQSGGAVTAASDNARMLPAQSPFQNTAVRQKRLEQSFVPEPRADVQALAKADEDASAAAKRFPRARVRKRARSVRDRRARYRPPRDVPQRVARRRPLHSGRAHRPRRFPHGARRNVSREQPRNRERRRRRLPRQRARRAASGERRRARTRLRPPPRRRISRASCCTACACRRRSAISSSSSA